MLSSRSDGSATRSATPASGRNRTTSRIIASPMRPAPRECRDDANERKPRVQMQVPGLNARERARGAATEAGEPVKRAVEKGTIANGQEHPVGDPEDRTGDQPVVGF